MLFTVVASFRFPSKIFYASFMSHIMLRDRNITACLIFGISKPMQTSPIWYWCWFRLDVRRALYYLVNMFRLECCVVYLAFIFVLWSLVPVEISFTVLITCRYPSFRHTHSLTGSYGKIWTRFQNAFPLNEQKCWYAFAFPSSFRHVWTLSTDNCVV